MTDLQWIVAAASLIATWLNIRKARVCFVIWIFTNAFWAVADWRAGLPAQALLHAVYFGLAVWGVRAWRAESPRDEAESRGA